MLREIPDPQTLSPGLRLAEKAPFSITYKTKIEVYSTLYNLHPQWEMGVVVEGSYESIYGGTSMIVKPGEMWWHGPWEYHGFTYHSPRSVILIMEFMPALFHSIPSDERFASLACQPFLRPFIRPGLQPRTEREKAKVIAHAKTIADEYKRKQPCWESAVRQEFLALLLDTVRALPRSKPDPAGKSGADTGRILKVLCHINQALPQTTSLPQAAEIAVMSHSHFSRTFKQVMGVTFSFYELKSRLERAHKDVLKGKEKLSQIAQRWGFADLSHFINQYRSYFGRAPGQFRQAFGSQ